MAHGTRQAGECCMLSCTPLPLLIIVLLCCSYVEGLDCRVSLQGVRRDISKYRRCAAVITAHCYYYFVVAVVSILLGPARLRWHLSMPQALQNQALGQPLPAPPFSPRLQGTCCVPEVFSVASHTLTFLICLPCPASEGLHGASLVHADQATVDAMGSQRAHISTSDLFLAHTAGAQMWPRSTRPHVLW